MKFVCKHCNQILQVSHEKVGRHGKCPKCSERIKVPTKEDAAQSMALRKAMRSDGEDPYTPFTEFVVYDLDDSEYSGENGRGSLAKTTTNIDLGKVAVSRSVIYAQGVLLAVALIGGFTLGVLVGRNTATEGVEQPVVASPCVVTGNVGYKDSRDRIAPDSGAVVIILPKDAKPQRQADPVGLRPDERAPDESNSGLLTIREIGGAYARADENGQFLLRVNNSRTYYVLYISSEKSGMRQDEKIPTKHILEIGSYFLPVQELIGRNQYHWQVASIRGTRATLGDVVFE